MIEKGSKTSAHVIRFHRDNEVEKDKEKGIVRGRAQLSESDLMILFENHRSGLLLCSLSHSPSLCLSLSPLPQRPRRSLATKCHGQRAQCGCRRGVGVGQVSETAALSSSNRWCHPRELVCSLSSVLVCPHRPTLSLPLPSLAVRIIRSELSSSNGRGWLCLH
jgi:hypothetical protein